MNKKLQGLMLVFSFLLMLSWCISVDRSVAFAAAPSFTESTLTIEGAGETHQLTIQNEVAKSTYKWYSSNQAIAKVNSKGVITTVTKGSATISCKITYPTGSTKTLKCKLTVTIPATEVKINNATLVNGAHVLMLGESYDFNRDIFPTDSSDKTYWSIGGGDSACIRVDDETKGKITATKVGKVILVATAAKAATEKEAAKSIIDDAVIIEVVGPTATVKSIEMPDSTQIKIVFDCEIDATSVIGAKSKLLDSISVTMKKDTKGVMASDPGEFTAALSTDKRTLTITSEKSFAGNYGVSVSSKVKSASGLAMEEAYRGIEFIDTIPPTITSTTNDESGLVSIITFSEAMNFAGLKVNAPTVVSGSGGTSTADPLTISILSNKLNYIASEDNKSLKINLANIPSNDVSKLFSVVLSGITDTAGNSPSGYTLTVYLRIDNNPRPQARPTYVVRTGFTTVTAYFDRAIQYTGFATVANGAWYPGVVDTKDNKVVHYTISEEDARKTGVQTVGLINWSGYNVNINDTIANQMNNFSCNFTVDSSSPVLLTFEFVQSTKVLTLQYNKDVELASETGYLSSNLTTATDDRYSNTGITYKKMASDDSKVIKILLDNINVIGTYTVSLYEGFVIDSFRNQSVERSIPVSTTGNGGNELPIPYAITQSTTNPSQIYVEFANKVDLASATNINNYAIAGVPIISAEVKDNNSTTGARVVLTVADDCIDVSLERPITIANISGYNGSYKPMTAYTINVFLNENRKATFVKAEFDKAAGNRIELKFTEDIMGDATFRVTQIYNDSNRTTIEEGHSTYIVGSSLYISLYSMPTQGSYINISVVSSTLTDMSGNKVTLPSTTGTVIQF